jgi:hypothetical protein
MPRRIANLVGAAVAGFADYGGARYNGSAKRTGTDFGGGFRFGSIRCHGRWRSATRRRLSPQE